MNTAQCTLSVTLLGLLLLSWLLWINSESPYWATWITFQSIIVQFSFPTDLSSYRSVRTVFCLPYSPVLNFAGIWGYVAGISDVCQVYWLKATCCWPKRDEAISRGGLSDSFFIFSLYFMKLWFRWDALHNGPWTALCRVLSSCSVALNCCGSDLWLKFHNLDSRFIFFLNVQYARLAN